MSNIPKLDASWKELEEYYARNHSNFVLSKLFKKKNRFLLYSLKFKDILYDFSKNLIDDRAFDHLIEIAYNSKLTKYINKMFSGKPINFTENRAVLHIALRNLSNRPIFVDGEDVMPKVSPINTIIIHLS